MSETATLKVWRGVDKAAGAGTRSSAVRARAIGARRAALDPGAPGPDLAIRYSCINANACKECMIELDGETVYACTARLEPREMTLEPLGNKKLVRDLVTEIAAAGRAVPAVQDRDVANEWRQTVAQEGNDHRTQARSVRRYARLDRSAKPAGELQRGGCRSRLEHRARHRPAPGAGAGTGPRSCSTTSRTTTSRTPSAARCSAAGSEAIAASP